MLNGRKENQNKVVGDPIGDRSAEPGEISEKKRKGGWREKKMERGGRETRSGKKKAKRSYVGGGEKRMNPKSEKI